MNLTKAQLEELTAGYNTPQEMEKLYSRLLQGTSNNVIFHPNDVTTEQARALRSL